MNPLCWFLLLYLTRSVHLLDLNFVIYYQEEHSDMPFIAEDAFKEIEGGDNGVRDISRTYEAFNYSAAIEDFQMNHCSLLDETKLNVILDLVWTTNPEIHQLCNSMDVPYFKADVTIYPVIDIAVALLDSRNGADSVFILADKVLGEQTLHGFIQNANIRVLVLYRFGRQEIDMLLKLRPIPQFFTVVASTEDMNNIFGQAIESGLVAIEDRWNLLFLDQLQSTFKYQDTSKGVRKMVINSDFYCQWFPAAMAGRNCEWPKVTFQPGPVFLKALLTDLITFYKSSTDDLQGISQCDSIEVDPLLSNASLLPSEQAYFDHLIGHRILFPDTSTNLIKYRLDAGIFLSEDNGSLLSIGNYSSFSGKITGSLLALQTPRRHFRIGTAFSLPWSYYKLDPLTKEPMKDEKGSAIWEGYCIDMIERMSQVMDFDYDLIEPESKTMGAKTEDGKWNGLIGDLVSGEIDIAIAALKMTAEREEVVDFVAPYFEQTGITIVIRKPVRVTSLFKFMTVLKTEVWLSILGALVLSALMIWFLDKFSPYSAQNKKYPYECRHFTLKESFWFSLTSFTPQGGGESPKSLSGRTLIAAYWLFVVLMVATFTANLAAFLTVERMQTPVQSLEQLAKQSRINYTVVEGSDTHQYFINMKFAEDTLYQVWKEITLNATKDQAKYRVWDYPVREQYGQILRSINGSNPVENVEEGFYNVNNHPNADYAFIHDSAEIKYELMRNCNMTEIGEVFAEQPYAVGIQQGSNLMDEITKTILILQKDRFFENLSAKYWNASIGNCDSGENEGISLESLGGVFIATIVGLGIAMITLVFEVIYYRRKAKDVVKNKGVIQVKPVNMQGEMDADLERVTPTSATKLCNKNNRVMIGDGEFQPRKAFGASTMTKRSMNSMKFGDYIE